MKTLFLISLTFIIANCNRTADTIDLRGADTNDKNSKAYNDGPIILFGDSVANGEGSTDPDFALQGCFEKAASENVLLIAEDGATSEMAKQFLDNTVSEKPALIIVSLGGNDVLQDAFSGNFPEDQTFANLREIYQNLTASGAVVVQMGLNPPENPLYNIDSSRLPLIKSIAQDEGVLFVENTFEGLWQNTDLMADMVHPNDDGYAIVCDRLKEAVAPHFVLK
ncbi:MAG: hypothetical protein HRT44_09395 [Bdellovibrionales bacterium]|nr:GDSL-type esterase/lipase family protein [Bdellovibrionales bacterium]NQZ19454.1 hypothetical protein [Bdellovibrionales bacterium]